MTTDIRDQPVKNTDRELFREDTGNEAGSYYENSVHITQDGHIGMNVDGYIIVQPISAWHAQARAVLTPRNTEPLTYCRCRRVPGDNQKCPIHGESPIKEDGDKVNHPSHYTQYKGLEVIDLVEQMNFNRGNAVKYIARAGAKNPTITGTVEDLQKAVWYLQREIARVEAE